MNNFYYLAIIINYHKSKYETTANGQKRFSKKKKITNNYFNFNYPNVTNKWRKIKWPKIWKKCVVFKAHDQQHNNDNNNNNRTNNVINPAIHFHKVSPSDISTHWMDKLIFHHLFISNVQSMNDGLKLIKLAEWDVVELLLFIELILNFQPINNTYTYTYSNYKL